MLSLTATATHTRAWELYRNQSFKSHRRRRRRHRRRSFNSIGKLYYLSDAATAASQVAKPVHVCVMVRYNFISASPANVFLNEIHHGWSRQNRNRSVELCETLKCWKPNLAKHYARDCTLLKGKRCGGRWWFRLNIACVCVCVWTCKRAPEIHRTSAGVAHPLLPHCVGLCWREMWNVKC